MSAYIVDNKHINTLVSYFSKRLGEEGLWCKINDNYNYLTPKNAQELASQLYKANVKSVNQRYGDKCSDDFKYNPLNVVQNPQKYSIGEIAKAIDGLEYQSCEFDGWHESEAKFNLNAMRKHLLANDIDYEEAETWEIS
jgi:hypothetical protein